MKERGKKVDLNEQLPPGLEYKPEYWEAALGKIEAHDKKVLWFNRLGIAFVLFSLGLALFWNFGAYAEGMQLMDFNTTSLIRANLSRNLESDTHTAFDGNTPENIKTEGIEISSATVTSSHRETSLPEEDHSNIVSNALAAPSSDLTTESTNDNLNIDEENGVLPSAKELDYSTPISTEQNAKFSLTVEGNNTSNLLSDYETSIEILKIYRPVIQSIPVLGLTLAPLQKKPVAKIREPWRNIEKLTFHWIVGYNIAENYSSDYWKLNGVSDPDLNQEVALQQSRNSRTESHGIFGFGTNYRINDTWGLRVNLHYSAVSKLNFKQAVYDTCFNLAARPELIERAMYTTKLHYLSLPIEFTIALNSKFRLAVGSGFSWLAQNDYVAERYFDGKQEVSACSFSYQSSLERRIVLEKGYLDGFRRMNFFSTVGLDYVLSDKILLGTTYQVGWSDITREGTFVSDSFDRNSRLYAHLRFNIWSK